MRNFDLFVEWAWDLITDKDMVMLRADKSEGFSRKNCYFSDRCEDDLVGKIFGGYKVIGRADQSCDGHVRWVCKCLACGDEFKFQTSHMKSRTEFCKVCKKLEYTTN